MPRQTFEREMQDLQDQVLVLGSMVEQAILRSVDCLKRRDHEKARQVIADDRLVNQHRFTLEDETLTLIATQQPVARDLRALAAVLEIATELERIGDYAKGIAKISLMIGDEPLIKPLVDIPRMASAAQSMMHQALKAFVERDVELARAIPPQDDEVDALYNQVYRELLTHIIANPRVIEQSNQLLWAAHNLERAADRVVNICERVVFTVTGELAELGTHFDEGPESVGIDK
jgi:phosphate transport system protein